MEEVQEEIRRWRRMVRAGIILENVVEKDTVCCEGFHFSRWEEEGSNLTRIEMTRLKWLFEVKGTNDV